MLFFQRSQFRRHGTHARHRLVAGGGQREEQQLDQHGQDDDRPAPVAEQAVDMLQQPEDWLGNEPQNAVVDGQFQTWGQLFEFVLNLGTGIQHGAGFGFTAGGNVQCRAGETDDVIALAVLTGLNDVVVRLVRNPGSYKVVLQPGYPATGNIFFQISLVDVFHRHLFVGLRTCPQGGTQIGRGTGCGARGRIRAGVALELREQVTGPGLGALVVDQVGDGQVVLTALEAEALDVVDTGIAELQVDDQLVLTLGQLITFLISGIQRTARRTCIRAVGASQTALCQVSTLTTVVEQLERNVRMVLTAWVLRQHQLGDVTTFGIDSQIEDISLDPNQVLADHYRGKFCWAGFSVGARYIGAGASVTGLRGVRQGRGNVAGSSILSRQGSLAIVLVPVKDHDVGHDCQGDDQDRAFNIHDYSAIEEVREEGAGGTGSKPPSFHG
ncbi:hypothetical protein D3C79_643910 [compost metagenome]